MATTTNFGWTTPDDTALVKDGASAIRTLGSSIDTSMGDLKGGTTGQILSKNSNSDMDFVWIANDQGDITAVTAGTGLSGGGTSGAVTLTNSMATEITASGDIIVGTGSGTFDNLPIGTTGQVLTADTTVSPYKVKWATPSSGGFTLLATATLSGTGTFTFSSISGSYKHLFINVIDLYGSVNDAEYKMQFNQDTANHSSNGLYFNGTSTTQASQRGQASFGAGGLGNCPIQRMYTSAGDFGDISGRTNIWIWDYSSTTLEKQVSWTAGGNARFAVGQGLWNSTSAVTRIDFIPYASTTATGTVLLYGVA